MRNRHFITALAIFTLTIFASFPIISIASEHRTDSQMKYKGVVYDVGLRFNENGSLSVEPFDPELVKYDINTIAKDLNANTIRIEGEDINRLVVAARAAHAAGLTVYFNPWKMNVPIEQLPSYYRKAAKAAEVLRKEGVDILFVAGCEISLFNQGILPGSTLMERIGWMGSLANQSDASQILNDRSKRLNHVLRNITEAVKKEFSGSITYASGTWEMVDWNLFDIVGVDYYRSGETSSDYINGLKRFQIDKPLVVMEVGSCAYKGASKLGAGCFALLQGVNSDGTGKYLNDDIPERSEAEQANYVDEQLNLINQAGADGVFIYVFSFPTYRFGNGEKDLDKMSFSLVKTYPKSDPRAMQIPPWSPKESFYKVAQFFKNN